MNRYSIDEFSGLLGITVSTLQRWDSENTLVAVVQQKGAAIILMNSY